MGHLLRNIGACGALALLICSASAAQDRGQSDALVFDSDALTIDTQANLIELKGPRSPAWRTACKSFR